MSRSMYMCLSLFLSLLFMHAVFGAQLPASEYAALRSLYLSTGGPRWTNSSGWLTNADPCSWFGITCLPENHNNDNDNGNAQVLMHVSEINLSNNNANGRLPDLTAFSQLQFFFVDNDLPVAAGFVGLTGPLPPLPPHLWALRVRGNSLSGALPSLEGMINLSYLGMESNQFTGPIPDWTHLHALTDLMLDDNPLATTFPASVLQIALLTSFSCRNCSLYGSIPPPPCYRLQSLVVSSNYLAGPLPSMYNCGNLLELDVSSNWLNGSLPSFVDNHQLLYFHLDGNSFTGDLADKIPLVANWYNGASSFTVSCNHFNTGLPKFEFPIVPHTYITTCYDGTGDCATCKPTTALATALGKDKDKDKGKSKQQKPHPRLDIRHHDPRLGLGLA